MSFNIQINTIPASLTAILEGTLDEHAELPKLQTHPLVQINLEQLTNINSIGVRKWIRWMQEMIQQPKIVLDYCPVIFVKNLSSIKGMLTSNMQVNSFYVPYYNDTYGERKNILFRRGAEFHDDGRLTLPKILKSDNQEMDIDVIEDIYFSFLKR
jgi:hypothetical protein